MTIARLENLYEFIDNLSLEGLAAILVEVVSTWPVAPSQTAQVVRQQRATELLRLLSGPGGEDYIRPARQFLRETAFQEQEKASKWLEKGLK